MFNILVALCIQICLHEYDVNIHSEIKLSLYENWLKYTVN